MATLRERIDSIVNDSTLTYDQKEKALLKMITKQEVFLFLGPRPNDPILLKDPLGDDELYLVIKKEWFDQIMSGEKKEEYRDFKEGLAGRYTYKAEDGKRYLRPFGKLRLAVGYHKNRDTALVEVTNITCCDGETITYSLGRILEYKPKE